MNRRKFLKTSASLAAVPALATLAPISFAASAGDNPANSPVASKLAPRFGDGRDWWFEKRFGMFVHWGLYAINGWHEQDQWRRRIPRAEYVKLAQRWNPVKFNPDAWLDLAERAGMKYLCLTTKHHDGFCLFESKLQPKAVINDRGYDEGDFGTPERDYTKEGAALLSFDKRTEACQSIGMESWGYRVDEDYYTDRHLLRSIDRYLARDANYLLNVGPKGDGSIPAESSAMLGRIGKWYGAVKESLEGVMPASHLTSNRNVLLTRKGNSLYVHLNSDPVGDGIKLKPLAIAPRKATLLNTGQPIAPGH